MHMSISKEIISSLLTDNTISELALFQFAHQMDEEDWIYLCSTHILSESFLNDIFMQIPKICYYIIFNSKARYSQYFFEKHKDKFNEDIWMVIIENNYRSFNEKFIDTLTPYINRSRKLIKQINSHIKFQINEENDRNQMLID
jgi:hypothetical protein